MVLEDGADIPSMPIESHMGEVVVCDFADRPGSPISPDDLQRSDVRPDDIVLLRGPADRSADEPYLTMESIDWLIDTRIKAFGIDHVRQSPPGTPFGIEETATAGSSRRASPSSTQSEGSTRLPSPGCSSST